MEILLECISPGDPKRCDNKIEVLLSHGRLSLTISTYTRWVGLVIPAQNTYGHTHTHTHTHTHKPT